MELVTDEVEELRVFSLQLLGPAPHEFGEKRTIHQSDPGLSSTCDSTHELG
jgi:hypothetical protein